MTSIAQPPRFLTSFLGRDRERRELRALFADPAVRLVSLVGPGGVGKTRLAAEVSPEIAADLGLRIGYVALSALGSDESVLQAVGRALNVADQPDLGLPRAIRGALERNPTLIVLDNFEHLLDQAIAVGELLAVASTRVIVTSRAPLEIRGEQVFPILPFGVPSTTAQMTTSELRKLDSVLLFEERARAVQHDFRLNDANAAAVAGICIRLDGLPLALELAAARSRMLAPGVLLARLDRPLEALGSGPLDSPDRHRSLRAALAWSYALLSPSEQVLFRRLAVPRGTFAIAAVEALADDLSVDPLDAISSLVSKSLVQPSNILRGDGVEWVRFQLLDTVREFALEKLAASDDFVASHNKFAAHIVEVALQVPAEYPMTAAGGDMAFDITGVDRAPALAALDWLHRSGQHGELVRAVAALAPHWFARGALRDAHACLEIALALTAESESADYARATVAMGMVAIQQGKFEYGEAHLLAGLDLARKSGAEEWVGQASFSMGVVEQDRGRPEAALPFFESARASFLATDRPVFAAVALNNIGLVTARAVSPEAGLALIEEARRAHRDLGFAFGVALADRYAGQVLMAMGELERARDALQSSLMLDSSIMQGWHVANAIETLALLDARAGELRQAALLAFGADRLREEIGVPLEPALQPEWAGLHETLAKQLPTDALAGIQAEARSLGTAGLIARAVANYDPREADSLEQGPKPELSLPSQPLTARELEVLRLMVDGNTNPEIADTLFISPRTVSVHVTHILEKLGVENRSAAVAFALRTGLVSPDE